MKNELRRLLLLRLLRLVIGYILANANPSGGNLNLLDPRLSDEQIAEELQKSQGSPVPSILIYLGILLVVVSLGWRIMRILF